MNTVPCVCCAFTAIVSNCRSEPRLAQRNRLPQHTQAKPPQTATVCEGDTAPASPDHKRMDHRPSPARVNRTASAAQLDTAAAAPLTSTNNASTSSDDDSDDYVGYRVQRPLRFKSAQSIWGDDLGNGESDDAADMVFLSQAMEKMSQATSEAHEAPLAQQNLMQPGNECMRQTQPHDDDGGGADGGGNGNGDTDAGSDDFDVGADTLWEPEATLEGAESHEEVNQDEADEDESDGSDAVEVTEGSDEGDEDGGDDVEVNENAAEDRCVAAELHAANEAFVDDDGAYDSDASYASADSESSDDGGSAYDSDESCASDDSDTDSGGGNDDVEESGDASSSADSSDDFQ